MNKDIELPLFDFATVAAATNNFSEANVIGKGGFGPVYKVIQVLSHCEALGGSKQGHGKIHI